MDTGARVEEFRNKVTMKERVEITEPRRKSN